MENSDKEKIRGSFAYDLNNHNCFIIHAIGEIVW